MYGNDTIDILNFFIWDIIIRIHENVIVIINSKLGSNHIIDLTDEEREQLYIDIRNQDIEYISEDDGEDEDN